MNHFIEVAQSWVAWWSAGIGRASMEGAIAIAVVWIINRFVYLSPRVTCWLWRAVCFKLLVALFWTQPVAIAILPQKAVATTNMQPTTTGSLQLMPVANETPYAIDVPTSPTPPIQSAHHITIGEVLAITWSIGVVCFVILTLREWLSLRRVCRRAVTADSLAIQQACQSEAARLGIRRMPQLRFSSRVDGPLLARIGRPTIILPDTVETAFDQSDVRLMLAHELAHLKRHDLVWNWLPTAVGWLFFFHPLVWLLRRSWSESQEAACDELLLQNQIARPSEYGRLLLKLSMHWPQKPRASLAVAGVLGAYRNLERRIIAMSRVKTFSRRGVLFAASIISVVAILSVIPWRLVANEAGPTEKPAAETPKITGASGYAADDAAKPAPNDSDETTTSHKAGQMPGKIYAWATVDMITEFGTPGKYRGVILIDPNTGVWAKLGNFGDSLRLSPDGGRLAFTQFTTSRPGPSSKPTNQVDVLCWANAESLEPYRLADDAMLPVWSPDGERILFHRIIGKPDGDAQPPRETCVIDLNANKTEKLTVPKTDEVDDWSQKGNWLVTVSDRQPPFGSGYQLYVMHTDGSDEKRVTEGAGLNCYPRFSPDGKQIVYTHQRHDVNSTWLVETDGGNSKQLLVSDDEKQNNPEEACWSPDGERLAVHLMTFEQKESDGKKQWVSTETDDRIEIISPDGARHDVIKLKNVTKTRFLRICDWK